VYEFLFYVILKPKQEMKTDITNKVFIPLKKGIILRGYLEVPPLARGLVIFSHGSGSSRNSPRNRYVADALNDNNIATLLTDLLTESEEEIYENRFDIDLLTERLMQITTWAMQEKELKDLEVGYFGASTGAASALSAAAKMSREIKAVVSRGGRPDLAGAILPKVKAPTLFILGSLDMAVIGMNNVAYNQLNCEKQIAIVKGASHLFEEKGKLEEVAILATKWFKKHLK
jgi:putative phosphoribosyl transferase